MATLLALKLHLKPDNWRLFATRKSDPKFKKIITKIFERDHNTCQFCGFQATKHQQVINLDNNYGNNSLSNLVTACCFCAQCFFLETVGKDEASGGTLIYLPEISQGELNGFCHVLFCAIGNATNYREDAQNIYRSFKLRAQTTEKSLGEGMSNPVLLTQMLLDAPNVKRNDKKVISEVLAPLRLLPSLSKFAKQIDDWAEKANDELESD